MNTLLSRATDTMIRPIATELIEDDELYVGYNDFPTVYDTKHLDEDEVYQEAIKSSYGKRGIVRHETICQTFCCNQIILLLESIFNIQNNSFLFEFHSFREFGFLDDA